VQGQHCHSALIVDVFVASGRYSHIGLGVEYVRIVVGTHIALLLCENIALLLCKNPLYMELGLHTHLEA
jgi:hypothetical protein